MFIFNLNNYCTISRNFLWNIELWLYVLFTRNINVLIFFMQIKINNLFETRFTFFVFLIIKNILKYIKIVNDILLNLYLLFIIYSNYLYSCYIK